MLVSNSGDGSTSNVSLVGIFAQRIETFHNMNQDICRTGTNPIVLRCYFTLRAYIVL